MARGLLRPDAMTNDRKKTSLGWANQPSPPDGWRAPDPAPASPTSPQNAAPPYPPDHGQAAYPQYNPHAYPPSYAAPPGPPPTTPAPQPPLPYGGPPPLPQLYGGPPPLPKLYGAASPSPSSWSPPQPQPYPSQQPYPPPLPGAYEAPSPYAAPPAFAIAQPPHGAPATAQPTPYVYGATPPAAMPPAPTPPQLNANQRAMRKASPAAAQRVRFIRLTYLHLLFAILAFAGLLYLFMTHSVLVAKVSVPLIRFALGGRWNWGVVLAVFMVVSWVADYWASHAGSRVVQYAGLAFYVVAEALIFVPLLAIVEWKTQAILARGGVEPHIVRDAAFVTLGIFTALTASVFLTNKDFSFLRSGLAMASGAALSMIAMSLVFGFNLGLVFSVAMVLLAAAYVLYQTSQVLAHYDPRHHVAAALALFSSVALMFWYVIRIFLRSRD